MINRTINKIECLNDLREIGGRLDEHVKIDMFMKKGKEFTNVDKFKLVWNMQQERIANAVTHNFQVIQSRDIMNTVYNALNNLNLEVKGRLDDFHDVVRADLVFQNQKTIKDGAKGIELGIRVVNSNNKKCSFRLEMYAFRIVCANGMSVGSIIPEVRDIKIHFGTSKIELTDIQTMTEKFIKKVINHSGELQKLVNSCIVDSAEWDIVEKIMKNSLKSKKVMKEIAKKIGVDVLEVLDKKTDKMVTKFEYHGKEKITRWNLYNAITELISHDAQLKPTVEAYLERVSQSMLKNNYKQLEQIYAVVK